MSKLFAELYTKTETIEKEKFTISKLSLKDQIEASKVLENDLSSGSVTLIKSCLKSWVTEDGVAVEITDDNILRLRGDVVMQLATAITSYNNLGKEKEKN
uniref:Uncharacterized protein n=1 Tax=viral metagenome TaxID=1070528 RepID=A0A6M3JBA3_9ZZZZ